MPARTAGAATPVLVVVDADQQVMRSNRVHNERRVHQYLGDAPVAIDPSTRSSGQV